jgi:hypothetical protein
MMDTVLLGKRRQSPAGDPGGDKKSFLPAEHGIEEIASIWKPHPAWIIVRGVTGG